MDNIQYCKKEIPNAIVENMHIFVLYIILQEGNYKMQLYKYARTIL